MKSPKTFDLSVSRGVATVTLNRPDRLNSLTFAIYRELADTFESMAEVSDIRSVVITGKGRGFCSGGDQDDIISELFSRDKAGLLDFTRATGRLIGAICQLEKPVVAALNGVAVGAGAVIACACDFRLATEKTRIGFVFPKVGLCGADMGAAYLLPRIVGLGHANELLYFGDLVEADRALAIGLFNRVVGTVDELMTLASDWANKLAEGPQFAHSMTKRMLYREHNMELKEALEAEAVAQAVCMEHPDFRTAHDAFKNKQTPVFAGSPLLPHTEKGGE